MKGPQLPVCVFTVCLAVCASHSHAQPPLDFTQGVSITLGGTNRENGIRLLDGDGRGETKTRVADIGGRACRATDKAHGQWWMNFKIDEAYLAKDMPTGLAMEVDYFDTGQGPISLMYRARVRGVRVREHHRRIGQKTGTNTWKTLRVSLPDACLKGWGPGWMLRLSDEAWPPNQWEDLYVGEVRLDRKGVWLTATPEALAVREPAPCKVQALVTDEAGQPVKNRVTVKFEASAGRIESEATTQEGTATVSYTPPSVAGDVEVTATCSVGEAQMQLPVVTGSGKAVLRKRVLGFEPGDVVDAGKSVKQDCERLALSINDEQAFEGYASARMEYSFREGTSARSGIFVGKEIPGRPTMLRARILSNRPACEVHFLVKDSQGQQADRYGCTLWYEGWSIAKNMIDSPQVPWHAGAQKRLQYPLTLEHLLLVGTPWYGTRYQRSGTLHFDYLVAEFYATESELPPVPLEVNARQVKDKMIVTLRNLSQQACKARASYWIIDPETEWVDWVERGAITKTPIELKAGEVVEFPLSLPMIKEAGEHTVEVAAVAVDTGDLVETRAQWLR